MNQHLQGLTQQELIADTMVHHDRTSFSFSPGNLCRLAPLSEGRVEADGTLMCAYHGWKFDAAGACKAIPQAKDQAAEAKMCSNSSSSAHAYPLKLSQGLLWIWPEAGAMAVLESSCKLPNLIPEIDVSAREG